jgi:hypothetical protein
VAISSTVGPLKGLKIPGDAGWGTDRAREKAMEAARPNRVVKSEWKINFSRAAPPPCSETPQVFLEALNMVNSSLNSPTVTFDKFPL